MEKFAAGLKKNFDAVRAGLPEPWSSGPLTKFKLVKRQGYGRSVGFDLLRARVLAAWRPPGTAVL